MKSAIPVMFRPTLMSRLIVGGLNRKQLVWIHIEVYPFSRKLHQSQKF